MIDVKENEDGTFTISWDENDPQESIFNDFKEEDFINLIQNYLNTLQESGAVDISQVAEAVNHINDHIEEKIIAVCEETFGQECYEVKDPDNWYEAKSQERGDQSTEQSQTGTVSPPEHFPLFP